MTAPLPISLEVNAPYETAIKYAKGSAIALTAVALTTLVPPVAGVLGVALATKTVFILTSAAFVSALTSGGLGLVAAINYRAGYQALFDETLKESERQPLVKGVNTPSLEKELKEAVDAKEDLDNKIRLKQEELDKINEDLEALRRKYDADAASSKENERKSRDKITALEDELEKGKKRETELKEQIGSKQSEIDNLIKKYDKELAEGKTKSDLLTLELEEKKREYSALEGEAKKRSEELASSEDKLKRLMNEKEAIEKKLDNLKAKERVNEELANKNTELERQIHALKQEIGKASSGPVKKPDASSNDKLGETIKALEALKKEEAEKRKLIASLEAERNDLKERLSKAQEKNKSLEKEIEKLNPLQLAQKHAKELKEKEAVIALLKTEMEDLKQSHERALNAKVQTVAQTSQIEIESLNRKLKQLEDELKSDKKKLSCDIERLEKDLEQEKKGLKSAQDAHTQEKITLENNLKGEIEAKQLEVEALRQSIEDIRKEHEKNAKEKEEQLLLKIKNVKGDMAELHDELTKYHDKVAEMSINAVQHEAVKEELSLSKKRINDFLEEQKRLREANRQLKEEKENNIELLELRTRLQEVERYNEGYQEEIKGKVSRIQALERRLAELEKELAELKGQPLESLPTKQEPTRWSVRKKELEWQSKQPKVVVNAGEDSKVNSYNVIPTHRLDVGSVFAKFKLGEECDHFELMTLFKETGNNHKAECKKDKDKKAVDLKWEFLYSKENLRKLFLNLSGDNELTSATLRNKNVHNFLKIGVYYLESDTLADIFNFIKSITTIESLNSLLEGYILRLQKGLGIAHDTTLEAVVAHYVNLIERNVSAVKGIDHAFFFESVFFLIHKNSDIVAKNLMQMDRLGMMTDEIAENIYKRCLSYFQCPDTNPLCIYLKERVEKKSTSNA